MVEQVLSLALPFLVSAAVAGVLRLSAGAERGGRLMACGLALGFLGWWLWARGISPAVAEPLHLAPHVMLGGLLAGGACDGWLGRGKAAWAVAGSVSAVCIWALAGAPGEAAALLTAGGPALLVWGVTVGALAWPRPAAVPGLLLLSLAALGLAGVAAALGLTAHAAAALALAAAVLGVVIWGPAVQSGPGWVTALAGGGTFAALAVAVLRAEAGAALPLGVLALLFLAEPTAARLPAGGARLAPLLRSVWLVAVAAVPAGLAGFLARVAAAVSSG